VSALKDIFGQEVQVDDYVAAGMSLGQSSVLRVGRIVGIKETNSGFTVRVRWTHNGRGENRQWDVKESNILIKNIFAYAKIVKLSTEYVEQFPATNLKEGE